MGMAFRTCSVRWHGKALTNQGMVLSGFLELDLKVDLLSSKTFLKPSAKSQNLFPAFNGWQNGYGGFTYSIKDKDNLIEYVKKQEEHHKTVTFKDELIELLQEHGIDFDEKYLL